GGERARAGPRGADHHADRGQLVFRLQDQVIVLARLRIFPVLLAEFLESVHGGGRWRDGIPRGDRRPRIQASERGGRVAVDKNLVPVGVHFLQTKRKRLEVFLRV